MYSQILQQGTNHKHVGLFFSNNGLWHDPFDYIVKKAYTRLNMLRKVRFIALCLCITYNYLPTLPENRNLVY